MAQEFKVGDVVKLKSGGPKMTVTEVGDLYGAPRISCDWFTADGAKRQEAFPPDALVSVSGGGAPVGVF